MRRALRADQIFDGWQIHTGRALLLDGARVEAVVDTIPAGVPVTEPGAGVLAPGMVDLQVNGGGGEMIGPDTDIDQIARICAAHLALGATSILPTLITDRPDVTGRVLAAARAAAKAKIPGFAGLHLEGPHLDPARHGAHDPALIRPMDEADLAAMEQAAHDLPALMVTLAPVAVTSAQIARLRAAGAVVSLGHTNCTAEEARAAFADGASCVTHLFNAMSQLGNRAPGLVGATLCSDARAGIIADGVHVAEDPLRVALNMMAPDRLFLVSDAMAAAGSTASSFMLNGRQVFRRNKRLTLADGTLAGADISLPQSVAHLAGLGVPVERALAMASRIPADTIGARHLGRFTPGAQADMVLLDDALQPRQVWRAAQSASVAAQL
ncbi:N-acetylglucosamine-6-phosphate deacetylase [Roseibaca ekhonensis]|uniref:N-acetylglucosamine-6-phosphate deacetylase n=1 Tax=Roseinatronobacter ekhonensis TaxID=254356 RepID=A0A3B0MGQ1_9RHOB|nr:N-acetylglucosamine-6-phosphate deacetylase [Roseibaca ekhonensis]SUZ32698.1 N-acetylglucosamine-6-phosphate deacetylase [Roseibaca ekhonensis]